MAFPPHHRCEFTYDFRPVGQGLFCRGELRFTERGHERKRFHWVYDCGSENRKALREEIDLYRRQLPDPKRLDLLVLSHFDNDHITGIRHLLAGLPVEQLVLPYLTPAQRMVLVAGAGPDNLDYIRFLVSPAEYLTNLPEAEIGTITFVQPGDGPLPKEGQEGGTDVPPEGDRPPPIRIESEYPTKHEFGNDPGMFYQPTYSSSKQVRISKGREPFDILGLWEFAFYNLPQPDLEPTLQARVQPVFEVFYGQPENQRDYGNFIRQLKATYRDVFGVDASGRNDISLVTYTGPIMRQLRPGYCYCSKHGAYPSSGDSRNSSAWQEEVAPEGSVAALYTGDLTFRNDTAGDIRRFLGTDRWQRIRFLQVPHHGSRHSWELGQAADWNQEWSLFSAGLNNRHGHPHQEVVDDLHGRNPILVNEMQGAAWGGLAGWRKR